MVSAVAIIIIVVLVIAALAAIIAGVVILRRESNKGGGNGGGGGGNNGGTGTQQPQNLLFLVSPITSQWQFTWDPPSGNCSGCGYLWTLTDPGGNVTSNGTTPLKANSLTVPGIPSTGTYTLSIKTQDSSGKQSRAATVQGVVPPKPADVVAPQAGTNPDFDTLILAIEYTKNYTNLLMSALVHNGSENIPLPFKGGTTASGLTPATCQTVSGTQLCQWNIGYGVETTQINGYIDYTRIPSGYNTILFNVSFINEAGQRLSFSTEAPLPASA